MFVAEHCQANADAQVQRAARRFGLIAVAGELATAWSITGWTHGAAKAAAGRLLKEWISARGGIEPAEVTAGIAAVRTFIDAHGSSRVNDHRHVDGATIQNCVGFIRRGDGERTWCFYPDAWRNEVLAGHDAGRIAAIMLARGMLQPGPDGKATRSERPGTGEKARRVYVVTAAIHGDGEAAP